jgi:hypothetical protein
MKLSSTFYANEDIYEVYSQLFANDWTSAGQSGRGIRQPARVSRGAWSRPNKPRRVDDQVGIGQSSDAPLYIVQPAVYFLKAQSSYTSQKHTLCIT